MNKDRSSHKDLDQIDREKELRNFSFCPRCNVKNKRFWVGVGGNTQFHPVALQLVFQPILWVLFACPVCFAVYLHPGLMKFCEDLPPGTKRCGEKTD